MRACAEAVLLYPVYALLMADAGLTTAEISSLFAIWSVVSFACEIPAGALADVWSRKRLYAIGELTTATGFTLWLIWPSYPGFAICFALWGLGGAFSSGTLESLVYDKLGDSTAYAQVIGRADTIALLGMLAATLLAAPAYATGGYLLVGIISIATVALGGLLALRLPDYEGTEDDSDESSTGGYLTVLRDGLTEVLGKAGTVGRAVVVAAAVPGFSALDEYLPLLSRDKDATTSTVPLLFALTALSMAAGSALAGRVSPGSARPLSLAVSLAAVTLAAGALIPHLAGMVLVSAAFGLLQFAMVHAESRLQGEMSGRSRTTVLSVAGFGAELCAVLLYAGFALPLELPVLFALAAIPLLATALLTARPHPAC
ncbi:putative MFS transporter [Actinoplanes missouriensis 431]|uniref:Putative MFS transporter n=1 Tax=Actinoplanes missouriensis (strain ATCC 14538 / DSM 43046 / CBS 188.64 / JCM 3121 / NBRC 102363 / NCIMB 12654 / NRRL B-3342 / UNCC 431) TaxID=512565 RepID=I0H099_ACTM4|nr:MFS transporter [Actinoplanes missouriensis]BAL86436.1 putative MFS transporter [Actinoplanes missouriensis 431]